MYTLLTEFCSKEIILYFSPNVNSKILIFSRENFQDSGFPFKSALTAPPGGRFSGENEHFAGTEVSKYLY